MLSPPLAGWNGDNFCGINQSYKVKVTETPIVWVLGVTSQKLFTYLVLLQELKISISWGLFVTEVTLP